MKQIIKVHASAGSGKTFQLAKRYVELLLTDTGKDGSSSIRSIIAITFTKKATVEMKSRIVQFLKKIALNDFSSSFERDELCSIGNGDLNELSQRAKSVLSQIIYHYDFFKVQTIDSLVREMLSGSLLKAGRSSGYRIIDDSTEYLEYGIDAFIEDSCEHDKMKRVFKRFLQNYIYVKEDPAWVPKRDILTGIKALFRLANQYGFDFTTSDIEEVSVPKTKTEIRSIIQTLAEAQVEGTHKQFYKTLQRIASQTKITADDFKKTFQKERYPVVKGAVCPEVIERHWALLKKAIVFLCEAEARSLYDPYIMVHNHVYHYFEAYAKKNDVIFLSELNKRIKQVRTQDSFSAPELCIRIAPFVRHYLIDEFQDTNVLNWENLVPLITESLSSGGSLFYVGDTKQAIYQFRGGDARLFDLIPHVLPRFESEERHLQVNFRSQRHIVEFTNDLFSSENLNSFFEALDHNEKDAEFTLSDEKSRSIIHSFCDSAQSFYPDNRDGYVHTRHVAGASSDECDQKILPHVFETIQEARQRGFAYSDIAILARSNSEIEKVLTSLVSVDIPVVSDKTLNIRNNRTVNEIITFLRFLESPIDNTSFALFIHSDVFLTAAGIGAESIETFLFQAHREGAAHLYISFRAEFPDVWSTYIEPFFKKVGVMPLYEFMRQIFESLQVFTNSPHSHAFCMRFLEFVKEEESDRPSISDFLRFFDALADDDKRLYVPFADTGDSIQLLTYHKAKGLEFPIVIIPFLSIAIKVDKQVLVCDEHNTPQRMRLLHLLKSYALWSDELRQEYSTALERAFISELNILYVALTRPAYELYVFVPERISGKRHNRARHLFAEHDSKRGTQRERTVYARAREEYAEEMLDLDPAPYQFWMRKLSEKFTDMQQIKKRAAITRGKILHFILSFVGNCATDSVDHFFSQALHAVSFTFPYCHDPDEYFTVIRRIVTDQSLAHIFHITDGIVFTEKDITLSNGTVKRLDRLILQKGTVTVIDYKSTEGGLSKRESADIEAVYDEQVREYIDILAQIYPDRTVKGYVLFIDSARLREISPS